MIREQFLGYPPAGMPGGDWLPAEAYDEGGEDG